MRCEDCGDSGVKATGIDQYGKLYRIACDCKKGRKLPSTKGQR